MPDTQSGQLLCRTNLSRPEESLHPQWKGGQLDEGPEAVMEDRENHTGNSAPSPPTDECHFLEVCMSPEALLGYVTTRAPGAITTGPIRWLAMCEQGLRVVSCHSSRGVRSPRRSRGASRHYPQHHLKALNRAVVSEQSGLTDIRNLVSPAAQCDPTSVFPIIAKSTAFSVTHAFMRGSTSVFSVPSSCSVSDCSSNSASSNTSGNSMNDQQDTNPLGVQAVECCRIANIEAPPAMRKSSKPLLVLALEALVTTISPQCRGANGVAWAPTTHDAKLVFHHHYADPPSYVEEEIYVKYRPHLGEFLAAVSSRFQIAVFTTSWTPTGTCFLGLIGSTANTAPP